MSTAINRLYTFLYKKIINACFYLCLLVLLWGVLQVFCFTSFYVPSDSMEPVLTPGDYILVNKTVKGPRLFNIFTSLEKKHTPIYRMPGFGTFKRNDVLVFNIPYPLTRDSISFDVMKYYVKRCIALPGDTIEIRNGYFKVNDTDMELGNPQMQAFISTWPDSLAKELKMNAYPRDEKLQWTIKEFGPLPVPAKGQQVEMNRTNWALYQRLIHWEQKQRPVLYGETVYLGDSLISTYTFGQNYYFMAGDKLSNSKDSRYWGMLPEEFIVGRADYVWLSREPRSEKVRWNRLMKRIQ